jgi:succinylglutamic semialdehyde dehydrogenase
MTEFRGNYFGGEFVMPSGGQRFQSHNPARNDEVVFEAIGDESSVADVVAAAQAARVEWARRSVEDRTNVLLRVAEKLPSHVDGIAEAICAEMGKTMAESRVEANSIAGKIKGTVKLLDHELVGAGPGAPGEQRHHPLGVVAILGPFNFPVHLVNTHLIPALLAGNVVVAKPSEVTPLCGQRYAELFHDAGVPAGVFNMIFGKGDVGAALVKHDHVHGVVFTGGFETAQHIRRDLFDYPHKKLALELGGKNPAVVLDDAALDNAVREIILGALLTTGQRCTATSRVIATPKIADELQDRLVAAFERVRPGDPKLSSTFMGPLATARSKAGFLSGLTQARAEGAEVLVESQELDGGQFVTPGLYAVQGHETIISKELFGPHVSFERATDEADAYRRVNASPWGLSASLFTQNEAAFERFYHSISAGVLNLNRSTNGASGLLPFGGVGKSGNWHPAGSLALRVSTYPVAVMRGDDSVLTANSALERVLSGGVE